MPNHILISDQNFITEKFSLYQLYLIKCNKGLESVNIERKILGKNKRENVFTNSRVLKNTLTAFFK